MGLRFAQSCLHKLANTNPFEQTDVHNLIIFAQFDLHKLVSTNWFQRNPAIQVGGGIKWPYSSLSCGYKSTILQMQGAFQWYTSNFFVPPP
jgi:hypothetical protein